MMMKVHVYIIRGYSTIYRKEGGDVDEMTDKLPGLGEERIIQAEKEFLIP